MKKETQDDIANAVFTLGLVPCTGCEIEFTPHQTQYGDTIGVIAGFDEFNKQLLVWVNLGSKSKSGIFRVYKDQVIRIVAVPTGADVHKWKVWD